MQVCCDQLLDLKIIIIRIDRAHAHIDQRIAHAGIFPVNQAEIPIRQEQEIIADTVNMGQNLWTVQTVEAVQQCHHMGLYFRIILKKLLLVSAAQCLIEGDSLPDIKRMVHMELGIMKLLYKRHTLRHIVPVARIAVAGPLIIFGDLITGLPVHVYNMLGDPVILYRIIDSLFLLPVDQKLRPRSRNPADIGFIMDLKKERFIRHTRLQTFDSCDLGLRNLKYPGDQLHSDIVGVVLVALIEQAELFQILEFVNLILRLFIDVHFRHREMVFARKMAVDLTV